MNITEAVKILRGRGYAIAREGNSYYDEKENIYGDLKYRTWHSAREIIKWAGTYATADRGTTKFKGLLKESNNSKNRSKTKNLISNQRFDDFSPKKNINPSNERDWW